MKVILDTDNTMGINRRDVDDGLTLMYLLGNKECELLMVTTTFGNDTVETVNLNTQRMMKELGYQDTPVIHGGRIDSLPEENEAAAAIAKTVSESSDDIYIVALGSLHNLYQADLLEPGTLSRVKKVISMGGVFEPLYINGVHLDELNYSVDCKAAEYVIANTENFVSVSADFCKKIRFGIREYEELKKDIPVYSYIRENADQWFSQFEDDYSTREIIIWDLNCGVYLTDPEIFEESEMKLIYDDAEPEKGHIMESEKGNRVTVLTGISDREKYYEKVFSSWRNINIDTVNKKH